MEIAFYVHHHGSGHLMRCIAIASALKNCSITFLGSAIEKHRARIPDQIDLVSLPMDLPCSEDVNFLNHSPHGLHYAPLNIIGQLQRTNVITGFLASHPRVLLVVDVSAEIAMLSRLCGIPTVVIRQHGLRTDLPHRICYRNAVGLLAPYDKRMAGPGSKWIDRKTFFTGGLSRFIPTEDTAEPSQRLVAVLIGSGGTSIDERFLNRLSVHCPLWTFHIIGDVRCASAPGNMVFHGRLADPRPVLGRCCIVIGNAGHNTVMECAALNKRFIAIAEKRPFKEQEEKARIIGALSLAVNIPAADIFNTDWNSELEKLLTTYPAWAGFTHSDAAQRAACYLMELHGRIFQKV